MEGIIMKRKLLSILSVLMMVAMLLTRGDYC